MLGVPTGAAVSVADPLAVSGGALARPLRKPRKPVKAAKPSASRR